MKQQEILDLIEETTEPQKMGKQEVDFMKDIRDSLNVMIESIEMEIEDEN